MGYKFEVGNYVIVKGYEKSKEYFKGNSRTFEKYLRSSSNIIKNRIFNGNYMYLLDVKNLYVPAYWFLEGDLELVHNEFISEEEFKIEL